MIWFPCWPRSHNLSFSWLFSKIILLSTAIYFLYFSCSYKILISTGETHCSLQVSWHRSHSFGCEGHNYTWVTRELPRTGSKTRNSFHNAWKENMCEKWLYIALSEVISSVSNTGWIHHFHIVQGFFFKIKKKVVGAINDASRKL